MANNESSDNGFQKQLLAAIQEQTEQMQAQNKKLDRIETRLDKLEREQRYIMDRNNDRDRSLHYLTHYQSSLPSKDKSNLIDNGTAFNAGPDDLVPEHPFTK